jgi:hypothetical protein
MERHWTAVCGHFDTLRSASSLPEACQTIRDVLRSIVAVYDQTDLGALTEGGVWELVLTTHSRPPILSESTAALLAELLRLEAARSPWSPAVKESVTDAARQLAMDVQYFAYTITGDYFFDVPGIAQLSGLVEEGSVSVGGKQEV